jgi:hypothetical protein
MKNGGRMAKWALGLVSCAWLLVAHDAFAGAGAASVEEARVHFNRGVMLSNDADFRSALIEFKRAYVISPNFRIKYNIGQTCMELQDYACAYESLTDYLTVGGAAVASTRRIEVEKSIAKLSSLIARVHVAVSVSDAEVSIDEVVVGKSPMPDVIVVGIGRHRFSAVSNGLPPVSRLVDFASGDDVEVRLDFVAPTALPTAPIAPTQDIPLFKSTIESTPFAVLPPSRVAPPSRTPFYASLAVTLVAAGGAITVGAFGVDARSGFDRKLNEFGALPADIESSRRRVSTLATTTDVLGGVALVGGIITTVLYFTSSPSRGARYTTGKSTWRPSPTGVSVVF